MEMMDMVVMQQMHPGMVPMDVIQLEVIIQDICGIDRMQCVSCCDGDDHLRVLRFNVESTDCVTVSLITVSFMYICFAFNLCLLEEDSGRE